MEDPHASRKENVPQLPPPEQSAGRIVRNSSITLLSHAVAMLFGLLTLALLARGLGPTGLGRYYTVFVIAAVVQLLLEAGSSTLITRRLARGQGGPQTDRRRTLSDANGLMLLAASISLLGMLLLGVIGGLFHARPSEVVLLFLYAAVACAAMQVQQFSIGVVRGFELFRYEGVARVLQGGLQAGLLWLLRAQATIDLHGAVAILALSQSASAVYLLAVVQWRWRCHRIRLSVAVVRDWLVESLPVGLGDILRRLTLQIDHLLLSLLAPPAMLGIYNVAIRPLGPLGLVPRSLVSAMFPYLSRTAAGDRQAFVDAFGRGMRLLWIASVPPAVTVIVLAEPFVLLLGGADFAAAALPMRVLATIVLVSYPSTMFRFALTAMGRQRQFVLLVLAGLVFETGLEWALIPQFGYMGACVGFLIGEVLFLAGGAWLCSRVGIGGMDWRPMPRAGPAGLVMALGLWLCRDLDLVWQLLAAVVFSGVYLWICAALGALRPEEQAWLKQRLRRLIAGGSNFVLKLARTLVVACVYFPYVELLRLLGPRPAVLLSRVTAWTHWLLTFAGAQRRTRYNIQAVHSRLDVPWSVATILRRHLENKHQNLAEWYTYPTRRGQQYVASCSVRMEGRRHLDDALSTGSGVVLLIFHFGAVKMAFPFLKSLGYDPRPHMFRGATYEREVFGWMARAVVRRLARSEARSGLNIIYHQPKVAFVRLMRHLARGVLVGMNADGMTGHGFVEAPFLGTTLRLPTGPAQLAADSGAPVVPTFALRDGLFGHRIVLHAPEFVSNDSTAIQTATCHWANLLEHYVQRYPWAWWTWRRIRLEAAEGSSARLSVDVLSTNSGYHASPVPGPTRQPTA